MADVKNVTTGKPAVGGAVYMGIGVTTLPTTVSGALTGFTSLGYCSDEGITNSNSMETSPIKAWGGDVVLVNQTGKEDTFKFNLVETLNVDVLKAVYGASNVTGDLSSGITVKANSDVAESASWVFDMIMRDGVLKRIVVPDAVVTSIGDIVYSDDKAVGYEVTITAMPDANGNTHYEYIKG